MTQDEPPHKIFMSTSLPIHDAAIPHSKQAYMCHLCCPELATTHCFIEGVYSTWSDRYRAYINTYVPPVATSETREHALRRSLCQPVWLQQLDNSDTHTHTKHTFKQHTLRISKQLKKPFNLVSVWAKLFGVRCCADLLWVALYSVCATNLS